MLKKTKNISHKNWLGSEVGLVRKTITVPANFATTVTENGRKIVKSGTVFTTPFFGLLFNDADITDGDRIGSLVIGGYYIDKNLPATAAAHVDDFAKLGLFPFDESDVARPDFGTIEELTKLATPAGTYTSVGSTIGWTAVENAVGYELYKESTLVASYNKDILQSNELTANGEYYLIAKGDNLYYTDSEFSAAITVADIT